MKINIQYKKEDFNFHKNHNKKKKVFLNHQLKAIYHLLILLQKLNI